MRKARLESQWAQTSLVACQIANVLCTDRKKLLSPDAFNPFAPKKKRAVKPGVVDVIKPSELASILGLKPDPTQKKPSAAGGDRG